MADQNDPTRNVTLYDESGNMVGLILDGSVYRLAGTNIITNAGGGKIVTVTTDDGGRERLDVSLGSANEFQLRAFSPVTDFDATGINLNTSTWDTLLTVTGEGKLDFVACVGASSAYRVRVTVDGTETFDLSMADLAAIGLSNATNVPLWAETANKNFRYRPNEPVAYATSLLIEAKAVTATPLLKYLITHREPAL